KLPYRRYVLFLMLEGMSNADLCAHLDDISLTLPDDATLATLREDEKRMMLPPVARRELRLAKWNPGVQKFLDKIGLGELYSYRKDQPGKDMTPWNSILTLLANPVQ